MNCALSFRFCRGRGLNRRAMTLVEVGVALVVATSATIAVVELVSVAAQQQRIGRQREVAQMEVANQAERIALMAWEETAPDKLTSWQASELLLAEIPSASCSIKISDSRQPVASRRIDLSVAWTTAAGQAASPAKLTLWKHQAAASP